MALTDMRLRAFSGLLVASVLAGCATTGSDGGPPPTDVLAEPVATPSVSNYRWVEVAEVLRRHLPMIDGQRGIYLLTAREEPFVAVHGQPIAKTCTEDWCLASMTRAQASGERLFRLDPSLGLLPIPKERVALLREKLLASAAPDDPDLYALKTLDQPPDNGGFWRKEDAAGKSNLDPQDTSPFSLPSFIKVDANVDWSLPLPEMVSFYGDWLRNKIAGGELEPLPGLFGAPDRALLRPLADGSRLLTITVLARGCGGSGGQLDYVIPHGSRSAIKVHADLRPGMDCPHPRGRTPEGLVSAPVQPVDPEARFYATAAHLEAASVISFERLASELAERNAPASLIAAARTAADDERRHAASMLALGSRLGVTATPVEVTPLAPRSTLAIAIENAVEGCVNEAFAAVLCDYQAAAAADATLATTMRTIAEEEHTHAALAAETRRWLDAQLDDRERALVRTAIDEALASLRERAMAEAAGAGASAELGLPSRERAAVLAEKFVAFTRRSLAA